MPDQSQDQISGMDLNIDQLRSIPINKDQLLPYIKPLLVREGDPLVWVQLIRYRYRMAQKTELTFFQRDR